MTRFRDPLFWRVSVAPWGLIVTMLTMMSMACHRNVPSQLAEVEQPEIPITGNNRLTSFRLAKKKAYQITSKLSRTFYCRCPYEDRRVAGNVCTFKTTRFAKRATRTEVEHIVPVHAFGQSFKAWRDGDIACVDRKGKRYRGRRCSTKVVPLFRKMSSDLYNLRPVVGALNALRSNFRMGEVEGEARGFGSCDVEIGAGVFEPPDDVKGDVARTYLYMDAAYPGHGILGRKQRKLMNAWHRLDPVSDDERRWAQDVEAIQGNANPFITGEEG